MLDLIPAVVTVIEQLAVVFFLSLMLVIAAAMFGRMVVQTSTPQDPNWHGYSEGRTP